MKKKFEPFKLELLKYSETDILTSSSDVGGGDSGGGGTSGGGTSGGGTSGGGSGLAPNEGPLIPA